MQTHHLGAPGATVTYDPRGVGRILVAHEPPLAAFVPDREPVLAANRDIGDTYQRRGKGAAMAKFIAHVMVTGPLPVSYAEQPDPDPPCSGSPPRTTARATTRYSD